MLSCDLAPPIRGGVQLVCSLRLCFLHWKDHQREMCMGKGLPKCVYCHFLISLVETIFGMILTGNSGQIMQHFFWNIENHLFFKNVFEQLILRNNPLLLFFSLYLHPYWQLGFLGHNGEIIFMARIFNLAIYLDMQLLPENHLFAT